VEDSAVIASGLASFHHRLIIGGPACWNATCSSARMLLSQLSLQTMAHGIAASGAALLGLGAAAFALLLLRSAHGHPAPATGQGHLLRPLIALSAAMLWAAVLLGTYVVFPAYRVTPPAGATDLSAYPRALLLADPATAWLHRFAMETKEHLPWIAAMLATAAAYVVGRDLRRVFRDGRLFRPVFALASWVGLLGILVNKAAPLQ
jgi:hypothetical protein